MGFLRDAVGALIGLLREPLIDALRPGMRIRRLSPLSEPPAPGSAFLTVVS